MSKLFDFRAVLKCAVILTVCVFAITLNTFAADAQAQLLLNKSKTGAPNSEIEQLVQQAEKDGSTVIIIRPGGAATQKPTGAMNSMTATDLLIARAAMEDIFVTLPSLWSSMAQTFKNASPDGSSFWFFRALATAVIGLLIGAALYRPIGNWSGAYFGPMFPEDPKTTADKAKMLLFRALFSVVFAALVFLIAGLVAIIFDPKLEPPRRVIFEIITAYFIYRILRYGVSWNLLTYDRPKYRLVNLTDEEAIRLHRSWYVMVAFMVMLGAVSRFFIVTGEEQLAAGLVNGLDVNHIRLLKIFSAAAFSIFLVIYLLINFKPSQHMFAPSDPSSAFYKLRKLIAGLVPLFFIVYAVASFAMSVFLIALDQPEPGAVIAAPFFFFYIAIVLYGIILILIQIYYERKTARFEALAQQERDRHAKEQEMLDSEAGEEMIVGSDPEIYNYKPAFRSFFEQGALAIIATVSLGELGRVWGVEVGSKDSIWASFLDIILASILCWLAYRAASIFIDRRIQEEGGVPEGEEEIGGEGGGAGATRMATLLPILRYIVVIALFSIAGMIILSLMGFDIGPIFAGAGVLGIAVGFGAQTLIRDIFSGAFFLVDDAFRKGEYVEIEGIKGTVEKISIRSFQLRHHLGALHTIPFGEIKQLTNYSRDWVMMKLPLRVTYDTDVEKVRKLVKKLGQRLLEDPVVGHTFMQPLKSQGVYKMEDSAMIIRVKFMTKPGEQFVTRKVVYQSIQDLFAREGIHFAHKEVTVRLADDAQLADLSEGEKLALTAAARSVIDAEEEEAAAAAAAGGKKVDADR